MKKILSLTLIISIIASLLVSMPLTASASASISIGDYIQMGTYYGKPILWRCVDIDENGPLMLSDRIICLKAFDGKGTNTSGSHGRGYYVSGQQGYYRRQYGSNYWADSNIRCWLNSRATAGNVSWTCGNPPDSSHMWNGYNAYNNEAGFLTNFSNSELACIKTVTQDSLLDRYEYSDMSAYGSTYHSYNSWISSVVQNAKTTAYREKVTDSMFLLDVNQINRVYQNDSKLGGNNYYIGIPSAEAVANSEYKRSSLTATDRWWSWLRSPLANDGSYDVRSVNSDGDVYSGSAYGGDGGVRPAFYLNLSSLHLKGGAGTSGNPYIVSGSGKTANDSIVGYSDFKSRATEKYSIPGLSYGMVPQGIAYRKDSGLVYITAYDPDEKKPSVIYVLNASNGTCIGSHNLKKTSGGDHYGHVGGIAVSDKDIYVANGKSVSRISLATMDSIGAVDDVAFEENIKLALNPDDNYAGISFCDVSNGMLWVGNFYDKETAKYRKNAYGDYNTLIYGYELDSSTSNGFKSASKTYKTNDYDYIPDIACKVDYENIQGVTTVGNKLILSKSYGKTNSSNLIIFDYPVSGNQYSALTLDSGRKVPVTYLDEVNNITSIPMMEDLTSIDDNNLYAMFESGANKYWLCLNRTKNYWQINIEEAQPEKYPVILIPGIMGSSSNSTEGLLHLPVMPKQLHAPQSDLKIVTAYETKADVLMNNLTKAGYKVYPCPYDWRLSNSEIEKEYLEPTIKKALRQTGKDKVIIIAHSMGGLVARTYIQSNRYKYDIDSLYMLGTPNEGSTEMIPLSLYGKALGATQLAVMNENYGIMMGENYLFASPEEIKWFVNNKIIGATQLLPTYNDQVMDSKTNTCYSVANNTFLKNLNNSAVSSGRYQKINGTASNKVKTMLLYSTDKSTLYSLGVSNGRYTGKDASSYIIGDETVPAKSAIASDYGFSSIWDMQSGSFGVHKQLMGSLSSTMPTLLDDLSGKPGLFSIMSGEDDISEIILQSVDEEDETTEYDYISGLTIHLVDAVDATMTFDETEEEIFDNYTISELSDGEYTISLSKAEDKELASVILSYCEEDNNNQNVLSFFGDSAEFSFRVENGRIITDNVVKKPISTNNNGKALLRWNELAGATGYKIYRKIFNQDDITLLAEIADNEYQTNDNWLNEFSEDCICYYVVPITENGEGGYNVSMRNYSTISAVFDYTQNGNSVTFENESLGEITSYEWDFNGDGIIDSTEENPTYTYSQDGCYSVSLTVSGPYGTDVYKADNAIKIGNYITELNLSANKEGYIVGEEGKLSVSAVYLDETEAEYNGSASYISSDDTVLTVDENGVITAIGAGTATVCASLGNASGSTEITVAESTEATAVTAEIKSVDFVEDVWTTEVSNITADGTAKMYIALFDSNMKLAHLEKRTINQFDKAITISCNIDLSPDEDYLVKLMIWDDMQRPFMMVSEKKLITCKTIEIDTVLESAHQYSSNCDETKTYTYEGNCESIDVTFSSDTETESGYDYIYILDANDNQIGKYSGTELAGKTINIPGNTVKIRLTSDGSVTRYGYRTESIVVNR